jgi:hypothetical protein
MSGGDRQPVVKDYTYFTDRGEWETDRYTQGLRGRVCATKLFNLLLLFMTFSFTTSQFGSHAKAINTQTH